MGAGIWSWLGRHRWFAVTLGVLVAMAMLTLSAFFGARLALRGYVIEGSWPDWDWETIWTAVAAVMTSAAVAVSVYLIRDEWRTRARREQAEQRALVLPVSAEMRQFQVVPLDGEGHVVMYSVTVTNGSSLPISDLFFFALREGQKTQPESRAVASLPMLTAGATWNPMVELTAPWNNGKFEHVRATYQLGFTDADGRRWVRHEQTGLTRAVD